MSNDNPQQQTAISADFPFAVRHVQVHGARMAYVDEGSGDPIVFLHGNPTSSYLWRNVIPHVRSVGRCIAPDLIGMGRSDKPDIGYRFVDHARYIDGFLKALGLDRISFVVHDWGSALGFDWAMRHESRVRGLAFMEAILGPVPSWEQFPPQGREIFQKLRMPGVGETMVLDHNMFVEQLLPGLVVRSLSPAEMQHYRAPFVERATRKPNKRAEPVTFANSTVSKCPNAARTATMAIPIRTRRELMFNPFREVAESGSVDAELVEQAKNGDRAALEKLILRHQAWVYNIAVRMVFQPHDAEEVTQEVLVKVITKLSTFKGESKFRTWLYRIAANHVLNMKRRSAETKTMTFADYGAAIERTPDLDLPDRKSVPVELPVLVEEAKNGCTMGMLLCLDRKQRLIFTLGEVFGVSDA